MEVGGALKQRCFLQQQKRGPQVSVCRMSGCAAVTAQGALRFLGLFWSGAARCIVLSWVIATKPCDNQPRRFKLLGHFSMASCIFSHLAVSKASLFKVTQLGQIRKALHKEGDQERSTKKVKVASPR